MKTKKLLMKYVAVIILFMTIPLLSECSSSQIKDDTSYTYNNDYNLDELNNYGQWIYITPYGRVWQPFVVDGWMPFDNGHWDYSNGNWVWVSYEPFGWIVYHYGNWYDDPEYGWVWNPGNDVWSPANVSWIDYGDYICWAPLPPSGVVYGHPWDRDYERYWHIVKRNDFTKDNVSEYRVMNPGRNVTNENKYLNRPPDKEEIQRTTGRNVPEINIPKESVRLPNREIMKMKLPPVEHQRIQPHEEKVRKEVLVPKDNFEKQQHERRQINREENKKH